MIKNRFLEEFEKLVGIYFEKLETDYGFKKVSAQTQRHEYWIDFKNRSTQITIGFEVGSAPWVMIGDVKNPHENGSSLEWLLVELGVESMPTMEEAFERKRYSEREFEIVLERKSQQLFKYADKLLRGDLSIIPKLQDRGRRFTEECQKYMSLKTRDKKFKP